MYAYLDKPIEYLKGVGPAKAALFQKELGLFRYGDLLRAFPFRYVDRTEIMKISDIKGDAEPVQLRGRIRSTSIEGAGRKKRLIAELSDGSGSIEMVWFRGIRWIEKILNYEDEFVVYGKTQFFNNSVNLPHPEIDTYHEFKKNRKASLLPVYESTAKLVAQGIQARQRQQMIREVLRGMRPTDLPESLPRWLIEHQNLLSRVQALRWIHLPPDAQSLEQARQRLKFEELFYLQLGLRKKNQERKGTQAGLTMEAVGDFFHRYYTEVLPFRLTAAQERVLREIRADLQSGYQMNRLLQGDVGSGKTVVALMTSLLAIDNGYQVCLMAPTEILAQQHYQSFVEDFGQLGLGVEFLSGSVPQSRRREILENLSSGQSALLIGTHAVLEDPVVFRRLGLVIIDEQHRFGVAQRARLWAKAPNQKPHVLVMTATPIPRTLAMTLYGDLDVSIIDELPPGRKPVTTVHRTEAQRVEVINFLKDQIHQGRQAYIVFPLIEESEKLDLENLQDGYERLLESFPRPQYQVEVIHGRMSAQDKEAGMQRFKRRKADILVSTTVIEVGVNVPNASVMVIENAERFGLSQLHQLRGRVGRGADQSYCILMSGFKLSQEGRKRISIMCSTSDGFEIAREDLLLRGPGRIHGTQQSGKDITVMADPHQDRELLLHVRKIVELILQKDPKLEHPSNIELKSYLDQNNPHIYNWSQIS